MQGGSDLLQTFETQGWHQEQTMMLKQQLIEGHFRGSRECQGQTHRASFGTKEEFCQAACRQHPPGFIVCISPVSALAMEGFSGCFIFVVLKDSVQKGEGEGCTSVRTLILCSVLCIYCVLLCYPFTLLHKLTCTHFNWCCLSLVPESVWMSHSQGPNALSKNELKVWCSQLF